MDILCLLKPNYLKWIHNQLVGWMEKVWGRVKKKKKNPECMVLADPKQEIILVLK